jgi:predicted transcriptional regulator
MLKELKAQHRNIIQLAFNGFSRQEIAEQLEIHVQTVSNVLTSPLGKAYLDGLSDKVKEVTIDVRRELVSMNKDALDTLKELLTKGAKVPASVKLGAAKDILDRTGFKPTDKVSLDMTMTTKTDEEIDAEIAALEESINKRNIISYDESTNSEELIKFDEFNSLEAPQVEEENILSEEE